MVSLNLKKQLLTDLQAEMRKQSKFHSSESMLFIEIGSYRLVRFKKRLQDAMEILLYNTKTSEVNQVTRFRNKLTDRYHVQLKGLEPMLDAIWEKPDISWEHLDLGQLLLFFDRLNGFDGFDKM